LSLSHDDLPLSLDWKQRLSRRLTHLHAHVRMSDEEVAKGLTAWGFSCTPQYIQQLRTGKKWNPTVQVVYGLAAVFSLQPSYFVASDEEAKRIDDQLALINALKTAGVTSLALRAAELTDESRDWLHKQVDRELRRSGQPPDDQA
jgi:hypothetical protein